MVYALESEWMKEISAGIIAGGVAGLLSPTMFFLVLFLASGARLDFQNMFFRISQMEAVRPLGISVQMMIIIFAVGFVAVSFVCGGLGAILGVTFVKLVNRLPVQSVYPKAFGSGTVFYLLIFLLLRTIGVHIFLDIYVLIAIVIDSLIFSVLYVRLTKGGQVLNSTITTRSL